MTRTNVETAASAVRFRIAALALLAVAVAAPASAQLESLYTPFQLYTDARQRGDVDAAARYAEQDLALATATFGDRSSETLKAHFRLGLAFTDSQRYEAAERELTTALTIATEVFGTGHPELVPFLQALATLKLASGDPAAAARWLRQVVTIEQGVYGEQHAIVADSLNQLREAHVAAGDTEAVARVDAELRTASSFSRDLGALSDDSRRYDASSGYATVRVFYGTNRARSGSRRLDEFYNADRGELQTGYVDVSIPETHKYGEIETESRFSIYSYVLGDEAKKQRYVLLQDIQPLGDEAFYRRLDEYVDASPSNDVFVFIHGYNVNFEDAARRAAQLAYDLDFDGTPVFYSWPSQASTTAYTVDEAVVRPSGRKLARLLSGIVARTNADRIHLLAHSMGNRALLEALQAYVLEHGHEASKDVFDQVVFTAPDVDHDYFLDVMDSIDGIARRATLYASRDDLALRSSRILHGATRAGLAGDSIIQHPAVDTIDMTGIDADMLGHSYFAVNEGAIYDLFRLFWKGDPPPARCSMQRTGGADASLWSFDLDHCRGSDLLTAGLLYRRFGNDALPRLESHVAKIDAEDDREEWVRILDRLKTLIDQ